MKCEQTDDERSISGQLETEISNGIAEWVPPALNRDVMSTTWRRALLSVLTVDLGVAVASRVVAAP